MTKRIISVLLALTILGSCLSGVTISYASNNEYSDINEENETVIIDGEIYKYKDEFLNGHEITRIINITDGTEDILYYNDEKGIVFLNNEPIAYIEKISTEADLGISPLATTGWRYHDTSSTRVTWAKGTSVAVVAGIIAAVIPGISKLGVIAKIGLTALSTLAASSIGGTIKCVAYTQVLSNGNTQCRYDWTFKASSGEKYGPYTTYQL